VLTAWRRWSFALVAAVAFGVLPAIVLPANAHALRVDDNPPAVGGQRYDDAVKALNAWYGEAIVLVVPRGLPEKADHSQLRVQQVLLVNPGWSTNPGQRPVVWLYLVAPVPQLVGKTLRGARDLLIPPGICVSWAPRNATDDWIVTEQEPAAGTLFAVTNCYAPGTSERPPPAVSLRAADRVLVPDVRDQSETDARAAIESAGLTFAPNIVAEGPEAGRVLRQSPLPGELVPRGSRVLVSIDRAAVPVVDPTGDGTGGRITPAALRTAATVSGIVALLLLLALLGLLRARRRRYRTRPRQPEIRVHYPDGDLRVDTGPGSASRVVSIRPQFDPGSATLEEVGL